MNYNRGIVIAVTIIHSHPGVLLDPLECGWEGEEGCLSQLHHAHLPLLDTLVFRWLQFWRFPVLLPLKDLWPIWEIAASGPPALGHCFTCPLSPGLQGSPLWEGRGIFASVEANFPYQAAGGGMLLPSHLLPLLWNGRDSAQLVDQGCELCFFW